MIPELGRSPGEGNDNPLRYSCLENPMDREACRLESMVGYSLWGRKESDTTERLHFHLASSALVVGGIYLGYCDVKWLALVSELR